MKKIRNLLPPLFFGLTLTLLAEAQEAQPRQIGPDATLTFEIDRAALTRDSKNRLDTLAEDANDQNGITEVQVAAWSDNPTPLAGEETSADDRALAGSRSAAIAKYLQSRSRVRIKTYNMADRTSGHAPIPKAELQILMGNGERSKAVALLVWRGA